MIARLGIAAMVLLLAAASNAQTIQRQRNAPLGTMPPVAPAAPVTLPADWCETAGLAPRDVADCATRMERATTDLEREEIRSAFRARIGQSPSSLAAPPAPK